MSYGTVQAGLIRAITNQAGFSCDNVIANDHRSLGDGSTSHAIIVFGGFSRQETSIQRVSHVWNFNIELYTAYRGEIAPTKTAANNNFASLLSILDQYPRLADTTGVLTSFISQAGPLEDPDSEHNPGQFKQVMVVTVEEVVNPNRVE